MARLVVSALTPLLSSHPNPRSNAVRVPQLWVRCSVWVPHVGQRNLPWSLDPRRESTTMLPKPIKVAAA